MIGLDTNILISYLTQDDVLQAELANKVITRSSHQGELLWIGQITLCETLWVSERAYKISKAEIINILHMLLQTQELTFEKHDVIWRAIQDYKTCQSVGFVDCLIGRQNESNDCDYTYTFDKDALKSSQLFIC